MNRGLTAGSRRPGAPRLPWPAGPLLRFTTEKQGPVAGLGSTRAGGPMATPFTPPSHGATNLLVWKPRGRVMEASWRNKNWVQSSHPRDPQKSLSSSLGGVRGVGIGSLHTHFLQPLEAVKASSEGGVTRLVREGETEAHTASLFSSSPLGLC